LPDYHAYDVVVDREVFPDLVDDNQNSRRRRLTVLFSLFSKAK
jgi:hypothetical protein